MLLPLLCLLVPRSHARLVNLTIDDTHGDARSGLLPQYTPEDRWASDEDKPGLFNGTGHFAPWGGVQVNVSTRFYGTKAYVFISVWTPTNPIELSFFLDDDVHRPVARYTRALGPGGVSYADEDRVLAFASDNLPLAQHELVVFSPQSQFPTWLFDYAIYTTEEADDVSPGAKTASRSVTGGSPSSPQPAPTSSTAPPAPGGHGAARGVRLGASIGGAVLLLLLLLAAYAARRVWRRRRRDARARSLTPFSARPAPVPEPPDKLRLWDDVTEKLPGAPGIGTTTANPPDWDAIRDSDHAGGRSESEDSAELRAQLERVRAEKTRALQEIAVLRRVAEPPPYSDSGPGTGGDR